ncbi:MAG: hypothetical protein OXC60_13890 [Litoreibacter sp.]|nr:hypothetical protein [Litoreibacter sp.]
MTQQTEIAEAQTAEDPFFALLNFFETGQVAQQIALGRQMDTYYKHNPPQETEEQHIAAITALLLELGLANEALMTRQPAKGATHMDGVLHLLDSLPQELADDPNLYHLLKSIQLQARIFSPIAQSAEMSMIGSIDAADRAMGQAVPHARALAAILAPGVDERDLVLRPVAALLYASYVNVASSIQMLNAAYGKRLKLAKKFFEDTKDQIAQFEHMSFEGLEVLGELMEALSTQSNAAQLRVDAEIAVQEERFQDALDLYHAATEKFSEASQQIPYFEGSPQLAQVLNQARDMLANQPTLLGQSIRMVEKLKKAQDELEVMTSQNADGAAALEEQRAFHFKAMSEWASRELPPMNINVNNTNENTIENQIKTEVSLRQDMIMSSQDAAMDEVLKLLRKLDPSPEVTALEEQARKTKAEPDMAAKIEKAAKVVDAATKIVEGAAKMVPYGAPVLAVLKGLYGGWQALSDARATESDDPTTMV